jgi:CRISPR-associated protein Cas1
MKQHLNTLFVMTQGAYLAKDGATVDVRVERESALRVPVHNLGGIVCFGNVGASPALMAMCGESDVAVTFLSERGRFLARVSGYSPGNVLLRREQYRWADDEGKCLDVARTLVASKLANSRTVLLRSLRDHEDLEESSRIQRAAGRIAAEVGRARTADTLDRLRGIEGEGAALYFEVFDGLIRSPKSEFRFTGRSRRPPTDRVNALLSFLYTMLAHDARAACESAGLDAAVGFLHRDRPGRPGLALDLMEELRAVLVDRLVLSLINRQQVSVEGFVTTEVGGVEMTDATRKVVLTAYQERKMAELTHPFLGEKTTLGLVLHLQARLLSRFIRGDVDAYPPFVWR